MVSSNTNLGWLITNSQYCKKMRTCIQFSLPTKFQLNQEAILESYWTISRCALRHSNHLWQLSPDQYLHRNYFIVDTCHYYSATIIATNSTREVPMAFHQHIDLVNYGNYSPYSLGHANSEHDQCLSPQFSHFVR